MQIIVRSNFQAKNLVTTLCQTLKSGLTKKDNASLLKAISECYMLLKQVPKARNYLKRASALAWSSEDADDIEKCWLLLASTYLSVRKRNLLRISNYVLFKEGYALYIYYSIAGIFYKEIQSQQLLLLNTAFFKRRGINHINILNLYSNCSVFIKQSEVFFVLNLTRSIN